MNRARKQMRMSALRRGGRRLPAVLCCGVFLAALTLLTCGCTSLPERLVNANAAAVSRQGNAGAAAAGARHDLQPRLGVVVASYQEPEKTAGEKTDEKSKEPPEELPVPKQASAVTLDQAINATLLADPRIRAGLEAINQANADLLTSALPPNPTFFTDAQLLPLTRPFTVTNQGGPPQTDYYLNYPIDWFLFGKRAAAMASAAAGVRVSEADYADFVRQRVRDSALGFYTVLENKALLEVARQDLDNLRQVEAATRKAFELGGRKQVELQRVQLDVLRSEQVLREAELTLSIATARLRALLGRRDADPAFEIAGDLDAALTAQPLAVEEALTLATQNRPDIASMRLQIDKAAKDIHSEQTKAYPDVTPGLGYTHQFQQKAIGFPDADSWAAAVTMTLPVLDRNQGNVAKARSLLTQSSLNLEAGLVDLRAEIVQIVREFETSYRTAMAVAGQQLKIAADVRDKINQAYKEGGRTILEVLDAQRNYRDTYRLYITSRANYWRSVYSFNAAIGKQILPQAR